MRKAEHVVYKWLESGWESGCLLKSEHDSLVKAVQSAVCDAYCAGLEKAEQIAAERGALREDLQVAILAARDAVKAEEM